MSEASARAIKSAEALELIDNDLNVIHAFVAAAKGKLFVADAAPERIGEYVSEERLRANAKLIAFLEAHGFDDRRWTRNVEEGGPLEVISRIVDEKKSDLLVVRTHGRSGLAKILLGSVTEQLLRSLEVDILAVPPIR